jgi:hypothetical protein
MQGDNPISWLMFFTLAATTFIIAGAFIYFLRSRTNREIAATALEGDGNSRGVAPSGAAPELAGFFVLALAVMGSRLAITTNRASKPRKRRRRSVAQPRECRSRPARLTSRSCISRSIPRRTHAVLRPPRIPASAPRTVQPDSQSKDNRRRLAPYHPRVPAPPLNGPTMREVIQPP